MRCFGSIMGSNAMTHTAGFNAGIEAAALLLNDYADRIGCVCVKTDVLNTYAARIRALKRPEPSEATTSLVDAVKTGRQRELQAIGAGISKRDLHAVETAYNQ